MCLWNTIMVKHKIKVADKVRSDTFLQYKCVSWLLPPKYMTYIHTYMTFYFFGKKVWHGCESRWGGFWLWSRLKDVFFPHNKNKNSLLKWAIKEERGFWAIEIPNKATGCLTYKLVLFIPGNKQTKWKTENNSASFASKA